MPVKDKSLYPADWQELATQIKESDNWYCVSCRRPCRRTKVSKALKEKQKNWKPERQTKVETVDQFKFRLAKISEKFFFEYCEKPQVFTLTVSHQDHDVTNNIKTNLKSLCSVCHLRYDAKYHAHNAAKTRAKNKLGTIKPKKTSKRKSVKK